MSRKGNSWTEQLYKYTEFYYYEPQHLNKQAAHGKTGIESFREVATRIRSIEVPLNAIFNITMRLLPSVLVQKFLGTFVEKNRNDDFKGIEFVEIGEHLEKNEDFTQPDMSFESTDSRAFVEMKIDAVLTAEQIYKYIFLYALWNHETGIRKKPHLMLLTKKGVSKQWDSKERANVFGDEDSIECVRKYIRANPLPLKFGKGRSLEYLHPEVERIIDEIQIGEATWGMVGDVLKFESDALLDNEGCMCSETVKKLLDDFLKELSCRNL